MNFGFRISDFSIDSVCRLERSDEYHSSRQLMDKQELERRTKQFAVRVIKFVGGFNSSASGRVVGHQLLKSGTSIGANYREANRAVSRRDFVHKITIAEKEASETVSTGWRSALRRPLETEMTAPSC